MRRHLPRYGPPAHSPFTGLDVLTLLDGRVAEITAFLTVDLTRFGLPARIHT